MQSAPQLSRERCVIVSPYHEILPEAVQKRARTRAFDAVRGYAPSSSSSTSFLFSKSTAASCRILRFPEKRQVSRVSSFGWDVPDIYIYISFEPTPPGRGGEDCDVTAEPLHERVPGAPLAPN